MKLGVWVSCIGYIKPSGNHYELNSDFMIAVFHSRDDEPKDIGENIPHSCNRYRRVCADFSGVLCG